MPAYSLGVLPHISLMVWAELNLLQAAGLYRLAPSALTDFPVRATSDWHREIFLNRVRLISKRSCGLPNRQS